MLLQPSAYFNLIEFTEGETFNFFKKSTNSLKRADRGVEVFEIDWIRTAGCFQLRRLFQCPIVALHLIIRPLRDGRVRSAEDQNMKALQSIKVVHWMSHSNCPWTGSPVLNNKSPDYANVNDQSHCPEKVGGKKKTDELIEINHRR